jgi:hypothetical protein
MSEAAPFVDPRRVVLFSGHRVDPAGRAFRMPRRTTPAC